MRVIAIDAIMIAVTIILLALATYRLWAPPLWRLIQDIRDDVDKSSKTW